MYSGHPWYVANWLLYKGGLILQCTFNREVLFGTLLGGCLRQVTFLYMQVYDMAALDRFHCIELDIVILGEYTIYIATLAI